MTDHRRPTPLRDDVRALWMLDPTITFMNHGCFGARLRSVFHAQQEWRARFEARPVAFLDREGGAHHETAKTLCGRFLGMRPEDFGFVTNATDGVNAVLRSLQFEPGEELVTTTHVYNAVRQTMRYLTERAGGQYREIDLPFALGADEDAIVDLVMDAIDDRTRLLVIDHVTSMTAIRLPVEAIVERCAERGVDVLIDGAHAAGMLDLDVASIGAAYYAGNMHKWLCAPSGAGFLWVRADRQEGIHPTVISHFLGEGLAAEFAWQGTRDISAWLTVPDAITAIDGLTGTDGWATVRAHNTALARWTQLELARAWGIDRAALPDASLLGSMTSLPLPAAVCQVESPDAIHDELYDVYQLEVPVFDWRGQWLIRPSCQIYNAAEDYERLADAVLALARRAA